MENKNKRTYLLLMMAGNGTRFGSSIPKQFIDINGEPIFIYLLKQLESIDCIDEITLITNPKYLEQTTNWVASFNMKKVNNIIAGGQGRSRDILTGLKTIKETAKDDDIVLIYDATHPIVDFEGCNKVTELLHTWEAATLAEFHYDTVYSINKDGTIRSVVPREELVTGASPEGFRFKTIYDIFDNATIEELNSMTSAGAIAIKNNLKMATVQAKVVNLKITYSADYDNFCKIAHIDRTKEKSKVKEKE